MLIEDNLVLISNIFEEENNKLEGVEGNNNDKKLIISRSKIQYNYYNLIFA